MLICRNAEGVHGKKKVVNPWLRGSVCYGQTFHKLFRSTKLSRVVLDLFLQNRMLLASERH